MNVRTPFIATVIASLLLVSPVCLAGWKLDNAASKLNFISIKKSTIGELHHFNQLSGVISDSGSAQVSIELASVQTNIDIRNDRMKKMLFETKLFPTAVITSQIDPVRLQKLRPGESFDVQLPAKLTLHGHTQALNPVLKVVKLRNNKVLVSTLNPLIINVADYKLYQGVEKLKEVAGLPSIASAIPVTFSLTFNMEKR